MYFCVFCCSTEVDHFPVRYFAVYVFTAMCVRARIFCVMVIRCMLLQAVLCILSRSVSLCACVLQLCACIVCAQILLYYFRHFKFCMRC